MEKQKTTKIDPQATDSKREKVRVIPINCFVDFPGHPFKVQMDDEMIALIESVKNFGIINPLLARKTNDEKYEIVAGRRRKFAALKVGLETLPVIVRDMTRDEAIIMMVDSNLQREKILPSERAFAYKMKLEALKRQGKRNDLTSTPVVSKLRANETVGSESGDSREQVRRYIRLTFLIKDLLNLVDEGRTVQCVVHTVAALLSIEVRMGSIMIIAAASCFMYVPTIRSVIHMSEFTTVPIFR